MTERVLIKAAAQNWTHVPWKTCDLAGGYTGQPSETRWSPAQRAGLPGGVQFVGINQGDWLRRDDTVIDFTAGAWEPANVAHILADMRRLQIRRPTVYASLNTVATVMPRPREITDLWLAAPVEAAPLGQPDLSCHNWHVVAWEWQRGALWDTSEVFDPTWPL